MYCIVCLANEAYAQHVAVMLTSLFYQNPQKSFRIFLMTNTMTENTKKKLIHVVESHGELFFLEDDYNNLGIAMLKSETSTKSWNPIMYLKLLIPQKIPVDVERFLFLDVDMIINHDIDELYNTDLDGNILAACDDYKYQEAHRRRLGLKDSEEYINSGVMVVDLKSWRKKEEQCSMLDFLKCYKDILNNDQDGFALYFRGEIKLLPNKWNVTTFYFEQTPRILDKYLSEVNELRSHPYIIHFCEPIKPWFADCKHPYQYLYKKYLKQTPWSDYKFPFFISPLSMTFWKNELKYWLNRCGIRKDSMNLISLK